MSIPLSKPKEGVIHLGPKSPRSRIQTNYENNASYTLSNTSQMEQINLNCPNILGESKRPNEHLEVVNKQQISMGKSNSSLNNQANKLARKQSPMPRQVPKKSVEKVILYRKMSPHQKIIVNQQPLKNKNMPVPLKQIDNDLARKNKILEQRVMQLHQEKQNCLMKLHQENNRLNKDNGFLKQRINEIAYQKQNEIESLKKQFTKKNVNVTVGSTTKIKSHSSLRNDVYIEKDEENNETSIMNKDSARKQGEVEVIIENLEITPLTQDHQVQSELKNLYENSLIRIQELELKNEELLNNLKRAEERKEKSQKIIGEIRNENSQSMQSFEKQNKSLEIQIQNKDIELQNLKVTSEKLNLENQSLKEQLSQVKKTILQNSVMIEENNHKIVEEYEIQIKELKKEIANIEEGPQTVDHGESEEFQKLKEENELLRQYQEKESQQKYLAEEKVESFILQNEKLINRVNELQEEIKSMERVQTQKNIQTHGNAVVGECAKCKQLLKTFMKLNCKTYQK